MREDLLAGYIKDAAAENSLLASTVSPVGQMDARAITGSGPAKPNNQSLERKSR